MQARILEKQREKELVDEQMRIEILRKQKEIELAENDVLRTEKELDGKIKKQAEADKYREIAQAEAKAASVALEAKAKADAVKLEGLAEAEIIQAKGIAEIEIVKAKGAAEANVMKEKAEAFKLYNDAAMAQMIIDRMPEIAQAIASPLAKTEKIVIIDNGSSGTDGPNGASKVTSYITDIIGQLPETVEAITIIIFQMF